MHLGSSGTFPAITDKVIVPSTEIDFLENPTIGVSIIFNHSRKIFQEYIIKQNIYRTSTINKYTLNITVINIEYYDDMIVVGILDPSCIDLSEGYSFIKTLLLAASSGFLQSPGDSIDIISGGPINGFLHSR